MPICPNHFPLAEQSTAPYRYHYCHECHYRGNQINYRHLITSLLLLSGGILFANDASSVTVELLPLTHEISPGETFNVAAIFTMTDGWHTYWQNPGESGLATSFTWKLPKGFSVINEREPVPERHVEDGIVTFIHEEEAIYLFEIQAPGIVADTNTFALDVSWLECKHLCRSGAASPEFTLSGAASSPEQQSSWDNLIKKAEKHFPLESNKFTINPIQKKNHLDVRIKTESGHESKLVSVDFFPFEEMIYDITTPVSIKTRFWKTSLIIHLLDYREENPESLSGVLVVVYSSPEGQKRHASIINQLIKT